MNKKVILYFPFEEDTSLVSPYQNIEKTEKRQKSMIDTFIKSWVDIYMARGIWNYKQENCFIPQFIYKKNIWHRNTQEITADLVLWFQIPWTVNRIFNTMRDFSWDKTQFEVLFPEYAIDSIVCKNYSEIEKNFSLIKTKRKVIKPQFWTKGRGVKIRKKLPLECKFLPENFPYLLQEFFDTSWWFYEFPWIHDFRVVILGGKVISKLLRQPPKWRFKSNNYHRGNFIDLEQWNIPEEIQKVITKIDTYFSYIPHRYYSIDMGKSIHGEIKVFEINSAPGLSVPSIWVHLAQYITKNILKVS